MKQVHNFTITERKQLAEQYFMLTLRHGAQMQPCRAGQFVEVLVEGCREAMLRRPISIHDADLEQGTLSLVIQTVGAGTRKLSQLTVGDSLNLVYPLGNGFSTNLAAGSKALLVGGGAGIAPLYLLAKTLHAAGVETTILLGGRSANLIPIQHEFTPYGALHIATDDGSLGHHGIVTTHPVFAQPYDMIYTCGPTPMMKAIARSAAERNIRCEASLENMMACGVGACLCCVVDTNTGHQRVCHEGPVFDTTVLQKWSNQ